jgi:hypothetical protein
VTQGDLRPHLVEIDLGECIPLDAESDQARVIGLPGAGIGGVDVAVDPDGGQPGVRIEKLLDDQQDHLCQQRPVKLPSLVKSMPDLC